MTRFPNTGLVAAWALLFASAPVSAQVSIEARGADLRVGGRLQSQFETSSIDDTHSDFFIRRARLNVDATFSDFFEGKVLVDFAGGEATLLDAWATFVFDETFELSTGQFKSAFDPFELASSNDLSIIERDGRVDGFDACTGVDGICSYSRLTEELGYAGRDTGVRAQGASGGFSYVASLTNGQGVGGGDTNGGKSVSGRASFGVTDDVVVSGNFAVHDYAGFDGETENAVAFGGDVQVGTWRDGFLLQASVVGGDNWLSLDADLDPAQFVAGQAVVSYYHPVDGDRVVGVEPLARVSIADPDDGVDEDGGTLVTPGVMFYFGGRNKIGLNLDYYMPQTGDSEYSLKVQTFLYF